MNIDTITGKFLGEEKTFHVVSSPSGHLVDSFETKEAALAYINRKKIVEPIVGLACWYLQR